MSHFKYLRFVIILLSILGFVFLASHTFAQTRIAPHADLSAAATTADTSGSGATAVSSTDSNLQGVLGYIETWRMISWLILCLGGLMGAILWAFGKRQVVLLVIGGAVILGGFCDFVAALQTGAQTQITQTQLAKVQTSTSTDVNNVGIVTLNNDPGFNSSQYGTAPLAATAQNFARNCLGVMLTIIPLCMIAMGVVAIAGSLFHENLMQRFLPGFILGSVLMFSCKALAAFTITSVFPGNAPNTPQLVVIETPKDSKIGTYVFGNK